MKRIELTLAALAGGLLLWGGCSSGPSRVQPPAIDADDAGEQAMELYDKDGDGFLAGAELDESPGIKAAMETIDGDKDGKVTADEIAERVKAWQATGVGVLTTNSKFTLDGRPLAGAEITFAPEPFLGDNIKTAVGETDNSGSALGTVPKEQRPTPDTPPGFQPGLYRIRVSKKVGGKETIPAKYNEQTTLGQQYSTDDPALMSQKVRFELTSK